MANSNVWSYDTLRRTTLIGQQTYIRASTRVVDWPKENKRCKEQSAKCATLENAFQHIMRCMAETTRQCQGYYGGHPPRTLVEQKHCHRFHSAKKLAQNGSSNNEEFPFFCHPEQCSQLNK